MAGSPGTTDRSRWPVRRFALATQPGDDLSAETTPTERLAMMWPLALEAWSLTGARLPAYSRLEAPVRIVPLVGAGRADRK